MTEECPQATYPADSSLAGDGVATYTWLSNERARARSSQCAGPVVMLNAPG